MHYQYLFGPVPSRRLGVSLGIDLVPLKTCSYNCIYCECGRTTDLTIERREYVPTDEVIGELDDYLSTAPALDYITFSGSGEPTLHRGIGRISHHIKTHYPGYRLALLTNGSLFWDPDLRKEVREIDVIIPSLDAVSSRTFKRINHPHGALSLGRIIEGLITLREEYSGEIWLEIFIIPGLNDTPEELDLFRDTIAKIRPERVQLNSLDRPGVVAWVEKAPQERLEEIAAVLDHPHVEVVGTPASRIKIPCFHEDLLDQITSTIRRRPCTLGDLSAITGLHASELKKYLAVLLEKGIIEGKMEPRGIFYRPAREG
ncbi:MAG: radical SAM protein [Methanomicrobiaceae archaeon]|nr:radical SAM protein [Methanomicrobiaceae archaeon]